MMGTRVDAYVHGYHIKEEAFGFSQEMEVYLLDYMVFTRRFRGDNVLVDRSFDCRFCYINAIPISQLQASMVEFYSPGSSICFSYFATTSQAIVYWIIQPKEMLDNFSTKNSLR
jgi:hypothetical protein